MGQFWRAPKNLLVTRERAGTTERFYDPFDRVVGVLYRRARAILVLYSYDDLGLVSRVSLVDINTLSADGNLHAEGAALMQSSETDGTGWRQKESSVESVRGRLRALTPAQLRGIAWLLSGLRLSKESGRPNPKRAYAGRGSQI